MNYKLPSTRWTRQRDMLAYSGSELAFLMTHSPQYTSKQKAWERIKATPRGGKIKLGLDTFQRVW